MSPDFLIALFLSATLLMGCGQNTSSEGVAHPVLGDWQLQLDLGENTLPIGISLKQEAGQYSVFVRNADEIINVSDVSIVEDSITMRMPLYDSDFKGILHDKTHFSGVWTNYLRGRDYRVPFQAHAGNHPRFINESPLFDVSGTWGVEFSPNAKGGYPAIGLFQQEGSRVTGTFITETGDYRYLEGVVDEDSLKLSCFDGSHAFLFKARIGEDSIIGKFWSGTHWSEPWQAWRDQNASLSHPDSLTYLKEGYDMADFSFKDLDGGWVSPKSPDYDNKVLLVQIMGTWCPNCVDETRLLNELYSDFNGRGLEVIALAFERANDKRLAINGLQNFRSTLGIEYPIAYAGHSSKDSASIKLPFLNHVMSYPTCIVIDRHGVVRKIRTGFYGPGTGEHYTHYRNSITEFIEQLLEEV